MKIGIFTFFQTNYGAVLQAYALQHYLEQQDGVEVEIVDFTTPEHLKAHKVFQKPEGRNPLKWLKYYWRSLTLYNQLKKRVNRTWDFKNRYYHFTKRYSSMQDVLNNPPKEDIYITGSDQVFNPRSPYMPVYYLGFDKGAAKKVAYAPSFGISQFSEYLSQKIFPFIKEFDYLSCRESAGADYLTSLTGKTVPVVLDPVFLHDAEEWGKVAAAPDVKGDFIFIYDLMGGDNLVSIAKRIKQQTKLPIVCLTGNRYNKYDVDRQVYDAGPAEFIGWIKNASYVVTDSFHGTVFSLIFERQFFTFIANEKTSSRIKNILGKVNLAERIITKQTASTFELSHFKENKQSSLESLVTTSKKYVEDILYEK